MINKLISNICNILNVQSPNVVVKKSLYTGTMLAAYVPSEDALYVKDDYRNKMDLFFSIAHELRHKWQIREDEDLYFGSYKNPNECESVDMYNLQLAEIDANAFAKLLMIQSFGVAPLFNNLSKEVKAEIDARCQYISSLL